ncbi:MAG: hypothetical protein JWM77_3691 [Rhodospirillales bacterium]|nr:hypothetical protein [Rhodospirillales bacterium]
MSAPSPVPPVWRRPSAWAHALRTSAAALLALYLAFQLELDNPASAAMTVLIVASPVRGALLSKSLYRLLGTVIGGIAAIALIAIAAQAPVLFLYLFGLWLGGCVAVATLLRHFRAYGALLAGYTIALIALAVVDRPEDVFTVAVARVLAIGLGILCTAFIALLTTRRVAVRDLDARLRAMIGDVARWSRSALDGAPADELRRGQELLTREIHALDAAIEFAAAESTDIRRRADTLRSAVAAAFAALASARSAAVGLAQVRQDGSDDAIAPARASVERTLDGLTRRLGALRQSARVHRSLRRLQEELERVAPDRPVVGLAIERLQILLDEFAVAVDALRTVEGHAPTAAHRIRLWQHRDVDAAWINGARAVLAVWLAGAFWIASGWHDGGQMIAMLGPMVCLMALLDDPQQGAIGFFIATVLASVLGPICGYLLLNEIVGFPLLAVSLLPFWIPGLLATADPRRAGIANGFLVFFTNFAAPSNPMHWDLTATLNAVLATLVGAACGVLAFRVLIPTDPKRELRSLLARIRGDIADLARSAQPPNSIAWENRMIARLSRLALRAEADAPRRAELLDGGFAALRFGREVARLRPTLDALAEIETLREPVRAARAAFGAAVRAPRDAAQALREAAASFDPEAHPRAARVALGLRALAALLETHADFFQPERRAA